MCPLCPPISAHDTARNGAPHSCIVRPGVDVDFAPVTRWDERRCCETPAPAAASPIFADAAGTFHACCSHSSLLQPVERLRLLRPAGSAGSSMPHKPRHTRAHPSFAWLPTAGAGMFTPGLACSNKRLISPRPNSRHISLRCYAIRRLSSPYATWQGSARMPPICAFGDLQMQMHQQQAYAMMIGMQYPMGMMGGMPYPYGYLCDTLNLHHCGHRHRAR